MFATDPGSPRITKACRAVAVALIASAVLAGCTPPGQEAAGSPPAQDASEQVPSGGATVGGDGSDIRLDELTEDDMREAPLSGELACSFSTGDTPPILIAKGIVASDEPAQGIVKVSGYVERVAAPGGFDGISDNPTFTGQGKTIEIEVTGAASGGGESPPRPAALTYQRADGASRVFEGRWQCGP